MTERTNPRFFDRVTGALLFVGYVALLCVTATDLGMSRDESFYVLAAEDYGAWVAKALTEPSEAFSRTQIDDAWDYNWEHPALMKLSFALSWLLQQKLQLFASDSLSFRFPAILCAGLLLWLIYAWGSAVLGRAAGLFAAVGFALMPRVFYHSHLAAFDMPIAFFVTLSAYAYWRALQDRRWVIPAGLAFGLALATKHNSWLLPPIFAVHYLWLRADEAREDRRPRTPACWLLSMLLLGPLVLIATWPLLWSHTLDRLAAYVSFHLHHVHYSYAYLGQTYFEPPFPVSVPFVMTLFTVPLTFLLLSVIGLFSSWPSLRPPWLSAPVGNRASSAALRTRLLWFGCALCPMLAIAWPSSPIFGGTKHWLTAYPFVALFAGAGFDWIARAARGVSLTRAWPARIFAAVLLAPSAVETAHSHPFGLSHYTALPAGVPGAAALGMNRQFWGFTTGSLASWLAEQLPDGGRIFLCDTTAGAWQMLQRDGKVPANIRPARSMQSADFVLVHHERHFDEVDFQAWVAFDEVQPVHVISYDGVPIISVYENPARRRSSPDLDSSSERR